tara:strand:+ start:11140 stop:11775 length:636 start_codon:yes stop_codon:yes gene_type:complete
MESRRHVDYRFRNESEMVATLGENWRDKIRFGWCPDMDNLLGKHFCTLDITLANDSYDSDKIAYVKGGERQYTISYGMLVHEQSGGRKIILAPITKESMLKHKDTRNYLKGSVNGLEFLVVGSDSEIHLVNKKITLTINPIDFTITIIDYLDKTKEEIQSVNDIFKELFTERAELVDGTFLETDKYTCVYEDTVTKFNYASMKHNEDKTFF